MASPIVKPEIPYNGDVPDGLSPGKMVRIQGVTHPNSDRFTINLQTGPNTKPRDDTALHLSVRLNQGYIARNTYIDGSWGDEQGSGSLPISQAQSFEILILVDPNHYKVAVNGQHFCEFPHRIPLEKVTHLVIDGDVSITLISWEGAMPSAPPSDDVTASLASQVNAPSGPAGGQYGPPQGGPGGQYGPPQGGPGGYGPPPGGYGPPPNYGPGGYGAQPGYGPPPPPGGQPEESGFWNQAQDVLAGAIASGAAEKLLSGLLSSSGDQHQQPQGYAPQNAQYGIYPELPRDDSVSGPKDNNPAPGPLTSLLTGLLSGGGNQNKQQNQPPQQGGPEQPNPLANILSSIIPGNNQNSQGNLPNQGNQLPPQQYQGNQPNPQQHQGNQPPPQQYQGSPQPAEPQGGQQYTPGPLETLLAGLLSGSGQNTNSQTGTFPPQAGQPQNLPPQLPQQGAEGQQQYGQYPHGPPPQQQEQRGPVESLLSGLLSSGGQQQGGYQQPQGPQVGGQGSVGGLGSMGSILSSLAGSVFRPNQNH